MMQRILIASVVLMSVVLATQPNDLEDQTVTAFFCADDGSFSGMSELHYVSRVVFQQVPMNISFCQTVNLGYARTLSGQMKRVLIATTGIGSVNAASCVTSVLLTTGFQFSRMIFVGTSGMSPVVGGFNPTQGDSGCVSQGSESQGTAPLAIGSVCVTSVATDMECGTCVSNSYKTANDLPNECTRPDCTQHNESTLFGPCDFHLDSALADEIVSANAQVVFPTMPSVVSNGTSQWWAANEAVPYSFRNAPPTTPRLFSQCAEADAQQIWVGAPLDYLCREYSAVAINDPGVNVSSIPCFVAMEGYAFLQVMRNTGIPSAIVRGSSNWDMYPMTILVGHRTLPTCLQRITWSL